MSRIIFAFKLIGFIVIVAIGVAVTAAVLLATR
jgi:hypothetical protein